jgi:hypothetical protein
MNFSLRCCPRFSGQSESTKLICVEFRSDLLTFLNSMILQLSRSAPEPVAVLQLQDQRSQSLSRQSRYLQILDRG